MKIRTHFTKILERWSLKTCPIQNTNEGSFVYKHVSAGADSFVITQASANTLWISENAFQVLIDPSKTSVSCFGETTNILVHVCEFYAEMCCRAVMRGSLTFPLGLKMMDLFSSYSRLVRNEHQHQ